MDVRVESANSAGGHDSSSSGFMSHDSAPAQTAKSRVLGGHDSSSNGFMSHDSAPAQLTYGVGGRAHFHDKSRHLGYDAHGLATHQHGSAAAPSVAFETHQSICLAAFQRVHCQGEPLCLAAFQRVVAKEMVDAGAWRAKGLICFAQRRR
ncbi:hypothetical protein T484DRAFT_1807865 [Baffinella frigidus]|nr:hypothetical protein T484DRAFT_1807865 [Cryptophyta sp. CCMP2293]